MTSSIFINLETNKIELKTIFVLFWKAWFAFLVLLFFLTIGLFWVFPMALTNKTFPLSYKGMRLWASLVFYGSGFRLDLEKEKHLERNQAYIIIANHSSILDIFVMLMIHKNPPIVFVAKEELVKLPILRKIYQRICITVNRSELRSRTKVFGQVKEKLKQGRSIVIFPEGGIADDTSLMLQKFKDGAFSIAISCKKPIAMYAILGLKEMFPESLFKGFPGKVRVKLIDIISTEGLSLDDKTQLKKSCFEELHKELIFNK